MIKSLVSKRYDEMNTFKVKTLANLSASKINEDH